MQCHVADSTKLEGLRRDVRASSYREVIEWALVLLHRCLKEENLGSSLAYERGFEREKISLPGYFTTIREAIDSHAKDAELSGVEAPAHSPQTVAVSWGEECRQLMQLGEFRDPELATEAALNLLTSHLRFTASGYELMAQQPSGQSRIISVERRPLQPFPLADKIPALSTLSFVFDPSVAASDRRELTRHVLQCLSTTNGDLSSSVRSQSKTNQISNDTAFTTFHFEFDRPIDVTRLIDTCRASGVPVRRPMQSWHQIKLGCIGLWREIQTIFDLVKAKLFRKP